jgi:hypothetical protein
MGVVLCGLVVSATCVVHWGAYYLLTPKPVKPTKVFKKHIFIEIFSIGYAVLLVIAYWLAGCGGCGIG